VAVLVVVEEILVAALPPALHARLSMSAQALRSSLAALSRQILELAKTRGEVTVKEIEDSTGANRNTIKVHVKKLAEQQYLRQLGQGRGARYTIK
jgi:Fic family protein